MTELLLGRVLGIISQVSFVQANDTLYRCVLRGALKQKKTDKKNLVCIGDFVTILPYSETEATIERVEERKSVLSRADNLSRNKEQLIASNIDQVLITASFLTPTLKPQLIDRYLIATAKGGMKPVIVINKIDQVDSPPKNTIQADYDQQLALYEECKRVYPKLGIAFYSVSAETGKGIDALHKQMEGVSSVFSGQSGVGKSSLINATLGTHLRIGEVIEGTRKGSHTTTSPHLIPIEGGGFCVDTPGIKSFGVWKLKPEEIQDYYFEIHSKRSDCRYPNCMHVFEPECAVKRAVESKEISSVRYSSYLALYHSILEEHKRR